MRQSWQQQVQRSSTHAELLKAIVQYLRSRGWFVVVTPRGGIPGEPGVPDLLAFKATRVLFIECKVGRDKLRYDQVVFRENIVQQGFDYVEAKSLEDVIGKENT